MSQFQSAGRRTIIAAILAALAVVGGWLMWNMEGEKTASEAGQRPGLVGRTDVSPPSVELELIGEGGYFMRVPREKFLPGEVIPVSVSSVPRSMIELNAVVGVKADCSPDGALLNREYIHKRESTLKLRAPVMPGSYAIVGYDNGTVLNGRTEAARVSFVVENSSEGAFPVSLDKRNYSPSEQIIASVFGVPREMRDDNALIGIYRSGAPQGRYSEYEYIRRENERIVFRAPNQPGMYEIRAFSNGSVLSDATMTARLPFTVGGFAPGSFNVTLSEDYYDPE